VAAFEAKWATLPTVEVWGGTLNAEPTPGSIETVLKPHGIACMASGTKSGTAKYYFYACGVEEEGAATSDNSPVAIVELSQTPPSLRLSGVIKASSPDLGVVFLDVLKDALHDAGIVTRVGSCI